MGNLQSRQALIVAWLLIAIALFLGWHPASKRAASSAQGAPRTTKTSDVTSQLAVVIDDIGYNREQTEALLALNLPITMAVIPTARQASELAQRVHQAGHQIIIHLPMQPIEFTPSLSPGTLTVGMSSTTIAAIFDSALAVVPFAVGVNNHMGSRFTKDPKAVSDLCAIIRKTELFLLDSRTHPQTKLAKAARQAGIPALERDVFLDNLREQSAIERALLQAWAHAKRHRRAIAIGHPYPETVAALRSLATQSPQFVAAITPLSALNFH